jgi:hypothetical protein
MSTFMGICKQQHSLLMSVGLFVNTSFAQGNQINQSGGGGFKLISEEIVIQTVQEITKCCVS